MNESTSTTTGHCFKCQRTSQEIPVIAWQYQGHALWVCCECIPMLIHKWNHIVHLLTPVEASSMDEGETEHG